MSVVKYILSQLGQEPVYVKIAKQKIEQNKRRFFKLFDLSSKDIESSDQCIKCGSKENLEFHLLSTDDSPRVSILCQEHHDVLHQSITDVGTHDIKVSLESSETLENYGDGHTVNDPGNSVNVAPGCVNGEGKRLNDTSSPSERKYTKKAKPLPKYKWKDKYTEYDDEKLDKVWKLTQGTWQNPGCGIAQ